MNWIRRLYGHKLTSKHEAELLHAAQETAILLVDQINESRNPDTKVARLAFAKQRSPIYNS